MLVIEYKHFAFSYITKHKNSKQIPCRNEHNPLTSYLVLLIFMTKMFTISSSFLLHIQTKNTMPPLSHYNLHKHKISLSPSSHLHFICTNTLQTSSNYHQTTFTIMKRLVGYHLSLCHDIHYFFSTNPFTQF